MNYIFSGMNVQCALTWVQDNCFVVELADRVLTATDLSTITLTYFFRKTYTWLPTFKCKLAYYLG